MTTNPFLPGEVSTAPPLVKFCQEMLFANHFGRKCCTSRSKKIGDPGTLFRDAENRVYRIIRVQQIPLGTIADTMYLMEGCSSPEDFRRLWRSIHRGHCSEEKLYWSHWYARAPDEYCNTCMHQHIPERCNECSRNDIYRDQYSPRDEV